MRVLVQVRPQAATRQGGDWLQLQATAFRMRELGVHVRIATEFNASLLGYDISVIWNAVSPVPALRYYENARRQKVRVVLMPFFWRLIRFWEAMASTHDQAPGRTHPEADVTERENYRELLVALLHDVDALLPNSHAEAECLMRECAVPRERIHVIWNGVDPLFSRGDAPRFRERFCPALGDRAFILCVARLAPRKNQLGLLQALSTDERPVVLMGRRTSPTYAAKCERVARERGNVIFIGEHGPMVVADALAAARVHVLVSTYDVAPLVTLEAAAASLRQVAPIESGIRDYLGDEACYASPDDQEGIRRAIDASWEANRPTNLAARVLSEFTWQRSARELLAALEQTLAGG